MRRPLIGAPANSTAWAPHFSVPVLLDGHRRRSSSVVLVLDSGILLARPVVEAPPSGLPSCYKTQFSRPGRLLDLRGAVGSLLLTWRGKAGFLLRLVMAFASGKSVPSFADACKLADYLGCSPLSNFLVPFAHSHRAS